MQMDRPEQGYLELLAVDLVNFTGKTISLFGLFSEISIQEDLFNPTCSGYIKIVDADNIYEDFPIIGEETIRITYSDGFVTPITREFVVYGIDNKVMYNDTGHGYTLKFCSEEMMYNRATRISRAFSNTKPSDAVKTILTTDLKSTKPVLTEESATSVSYISPMISPFATIYAMTSRSYSLTNQLGSLFLFFENLRGFNLTSIDTLIKAEPWNYFIGNANYAGAETDRLVTKHMFISPINTVSNMMGGGLGVKVKVLNDDTKELVDASFDYFDDKQYQSVDRINSANPDLRLTSNRFKYKQNDSAYEVLVGSDAVRDLAHAKRKAKLSSFTNGPKVHVEVPFNAALTVGDVIDLFVPTGYSDEKLESTLPDQYLSGKYLVTALRQIMMVGSGITAMELTRDTYTSSHDINVEKTNRRMGVV